jgi:hypothetical protein
MIVSTPRDLRRGMRPIVTPSQGRGNMRTVEEIKAGPCRRASLAVVAAKLRKDSCGITGPLTEHLYLRAWGWSGAYIQALADVEDEQ